VKKHISYGKKSSQRRSRGRQIAHTLSAFACADALCGLLVHFVTERRPAGLVLAGCCNHGLIFAAMMLSGDVVHQSITETDEAMTKKLFGPRKTALAIVGIALMLASTTFNLGAFFSALGIALILFAVGASFWEARARSR